MSCSMGGQHYPVDKLLYKSIIVQSTYPLHSDLHGGTTGAWATFDARE